MGVDHRGPDVGVAEKRLDRPDVVIRLQEVSGETMAEGVGGDALWFFFYREGAKVARKSYILHKQRVRD
jgi:hypothetical protein